MVNFKERIKIANPKKGKTLRMEMIGDNGATYTQIPSSLLSNLNIERKYKRMSKIATGEIIESNGEVLITMRDETLTTFVTFGDEATEPLLGAVTLEQFGLAIDPVNKTLVPEPRLDFSKLVSIINETGG